MRVLAIESSCDETAAAVLSVESEFQQSIHSEVLASQVKLHAEYGGVVPELAAREHSEALPIIVHEALTRAEVALGDLDGIVVTTGPGLKGCLLMGIGYAQGLSVAADLPLVGVNHIEGHLLAPFLSASGLEYPYLALIVSGGHTEIQAVHGYREYELIARTIDDAAGEAFDKSANLLGIEYPGGAALASLADNSGLTGSPFYTLPRVMREAEGFSFSGLKTAIAQLVRSVDREQEREKLAYAIQDAIVDALLFKMKKAVKKTGIKNIAVTGGVAANRTLRVALKKINGVELFAPEMRHCVDNAAMIGLAGALALLRNSVADLNCRPRWPLEDLVNS